MQYPATPTHYILNGGLGDVIAASPVIKYAIENFHKDGKYLVSTVPAYRDIFWFVPDNRFNSIFKRYEFKEEYFQARTYPLHEVKAPRSILSKVASYNLINKILNEEDYSYPLYPKNINVEKFNLNLEKCIIIPVGFRSHIRKWKENTLKKLTEWIVQNNYIPVLIGTSKEPFDPNERTVKNLNGLETKIPDLSEFNNCINLIGKTEILDLIGLFQKSACVIGYDSGMVHLAGLTDIPIICAYTYVNPQARMVIRHGKMGWNLHAVTPGSDQCRFCYTDWHMNNYVFEDCWSGTLECCELKLDQFIEPLKKILNI